jgi:hypothetical protein
MPERFPIGTRFKNREVVDIKTHIQTQEKPISKGNGQISFKVYRKLYRVKCLECSGERWIRLDGVSRGTNPPACTCGATPPNWGPRPKWNIENWLAGGRPYKPLNQSSKKYGVSRQKVRRALVCTFLHAEQNGLCAFCTMPVSVVGSHVDHHHESDRVRGLVHPLCNYLIGVLEAALTAGVPLPSISQIVKGFFTYFEKPPLPLGPPE